MPTDPLHPLGPREDIRGAPFHFINGTFYCRLSGAETEGGVLILDTFRTEPGGPPVHRHDDVDEWFEVREGRFRIRVGESVHEMGPGDAFLGPRGQTHTFANVSQTGRLFIVFTPAGAMKAFFREGAERGPMSPRDFAALSAEHGMTVLGAPLI